MRPNPVDALISLDAFDYSERSDSLFRVAMRHAFELHFARCGQWRRLCEARGVTPQTWSRNGGDPEDIPWMFVQVLKYYRLSSIPDEEIALELTSSGTSGQKSRIVLDETSLSRVKTIARKVYDALGMVSPEQEVNYLCFTYDPRVANDLGTAYTDELLTSFTARKSVYYAIQWKEETGSFEFEVDGSIEALERFARDEAPVRLLGFPAFIARLLKERRRRGLKPLQLGEESWVLTGGGWKNEEGKKVPKSEFRKRLADELGIPESNVRDLFGMVEHGVPYVDCELGNLHIPIYGRALTRDPLSLEPLPHGHRGLLHLFTPYLSSYPSISLLTTDMARVEPGCECGRKGPVLVIEGRGGLTKHVGCALKAGQLLSGKEEA